MIIIFIQPHKICILDRKKKKESNRRVNKFQQLIKYQECKEHKNQGFVLKASSLEGGTAWENSSRKGEE